MKGYVFLFIILATFIVYLPAIQGDFIWDDDAYVSKNPLLTAQDGLKRIWATTESPQYYPMVFTSFWVEYRLWGLNPIGYHVINVVLHVINALLIWAILRQLGVRWAWLIGAIFALHPVHAESVAWITERKNLLSGMFYLLSINSYLRFKADEQLKWYIGALGLFMLALLSKTVTASLPVVFLLIHWMRGWRIGWRDLRLLSPFFMLGLGMGLLTAWYEVHHVGARGEEWALSMGQRVLLSGRALWFYAIKLVLPVNLTFIYPRWNLDVRDIVQWLYLAGFIVFTLALWFFRERSGRGPLAGVLFFAVTLFPALGFFNVYPMRYSFVADHFQYLASIGLIALFVNLAGWLGGMVQTVLTPLRHKYAGTSIGLAVILLLSLLTWKQAHTYTSLEILWRDTLSKNPRSWLAHNNLGIIVGEKGKRDEAIEHFQQALSVSPMDPDTHYNLANIKLSQGKAEEAIEHYQAALLGKPDEIKARNNLGNLLQMQGRIDEAVVHYQKALLVRPDSHLTHNNLGMAFMKQGRLDEAIEHFQQSLKITPGYADARLNLSTALVKSGRPDDAIQNLRKGLSLAPNHADMSYKLSWLLSTSPRADLRNGTEAIQLAQRLCQATGYKNPAAMDALAAAYAEEGRFEDAVKTAKQAIQQALSTGKTDLANQIEERLRMYEAGKAYRVSAMHY